MEEPKEITSDMIGAAAFYSHHDHFDSQFKSSDAGPKHALDYHARKKRKRIKKRSRPRPRPN